MPQVVHTLKSLSSEALLAVSQLCTTWSNFSGSSFCRVILEPRRLDHAAAQWRRRLLVLADKIGLADRAAKLFQHLEQLALGQTIFSSSHQPQPTISPRG